MKLMKHEVGLSMVELLIALVISSFLILGITQVYIDNKRNYVYQQNQAGNVENSRFAALVINDYLGKAGYRRSPSALLDIVFPARGATGGCQAFSAGHASTGLDPDEGIGFCIRYQPQVSNELDCQGVASPVVHTRHSLRRHQMRVNSPFWLSSMSQVATGNCKAARCFARA